MFHLLLVFAFYYDFRYYIASVVPLHLCDSLYASISVNKIVSAVIRRGEKNKIQQKIIFIKIFFEYLNVLFEIFKLSIEELHLLYLLLKVYHHRD